MLKSCLERTSVRFLLEFRPTKLLTWHLAKAAQRKLYIPVLFFLSVYFFHCAGCAKILSGKYLSDFRGNCSCVQLNNYHDFGFVFQADLSLEKLKD